jgi:hypothetical protein
MSNYRLLNLGYVTSYRCKYISAILLIGLSLLCGCSHTEKVLMPPAVDLRTYKAIGVIDFSTNGGGDLRQYVTQNFIQTVQSAQPGVRFLELGDKAHVLTRVGRKQLDPEAIRLIGRTYNVEALIFGQFNLSDLKPKVRLSSTWQSMHAGAYVEAYLMAKLWETASSITLWTNSTVTKESVAKLTVDANGNFGFGASDPEDAYGNLVPHLVYTNTSDLRAYYIYRKVK